MSEETWLAWGWRVPFLLSIVLLAVSLWMRLKLKESPVFKEMKESGGCASNPFRESFTYPGNRKRLFLALFGIAAGLTVIWYTAMFTTLSFLQGPMRLDPTSAQLIVGFSAFIGMGWYVLFGSLSDRIGRKKPIMIGYALTLVLLFPMFWLMGSTANPSLVAAAERAPVTIQRDACSFDPFAPRQADLCGQVLGELGRLGVRYQYSGGAPASDVGLTIGGAAARVSEAAQVQPMLEAAGYNFTPQVPDAAAVASILFALMVLMCLSGATYGPVAALLSEMFPARIRYSSMSIPYHFGTGYFGGFLPFISSLIVAKTGDPYAGLWYTWGVVLMSLVVTWFLLDERKLEPAGG